MSTCISNIRLYPVCCENEILTRGMMEHNLVASDVFISNKACEDWNCLLIYWSLLMIPKALN